MPNRHLRVQISDSVTKILGTHHTVYPRCSLSPTSPSSSHSKNHCYRNYPQRPGAWASNINGRLHFKYAFYKMFHQVFKHILCGPNHAIARAKWVCRHFSGILLKLYNFLLVWYFLSIEVLFHNKTHSMDIGK